MRCQQPTAGEGEERDSGGILPLQRCCAEKHTFLFCRAGFDFVSSPALTKSVYLMDISALDNQLRLDFVPRPGIVYFLTTDDCIDREWERYLNRLKIMMERHGLRVTTRREARADLSL